MNKKVKTWIILGSVIFTIIIFLEIYLIFGTSNKRININKLLHDYNHNQKMIYSDYNDIYYNNCLYNYDYEIIWIDDEHFVYKNDRKYYIVANSTTELLFDDKTIDYGSLFIINNMVYYKNNEYYYVYDIELDISTNISIDNYFKARDGEEYKIEKKIEKGKEVLYFHDKTGVEKKVKKSTLLKNTLLSKINDKQINIRLFNYSVWDDQIILHLYAGPYCILMKYDFEKDIIEYYDWFYRETSRTCYLVFKITNKDSNPELKDLIKS